MRVSPDFEDELQKIDPRLSIVPNPNRPQISNIKLDGVDVCPIPRYEIRDDVDPTYMIELPNGSFGRHRSRQEALAQIHQVLKMITTKEGADQFFGLNGY